MDNKRLPVRFYCSPTGQEPVRDWLKKLTPTERKIIGQDIKTVEYGWPIGMPTCKAMGNGLFEVRSDLPNRTIARILFCVDQNQLVLLHGFIKKTQKTPKQDLDLALTRKKSLRSGHDS